MTSLHTPAALAAALRFLADDLAELPDLLLPELAVNVQVHVTSYHNGAEADRVAAVDLLARAALGVDGAHQRMRDGHWHHGVPLDDRERPDGLRVDVFTAQVSAPAEAVAA